MKDSPKFDPLHCDDLRKFGKEMERIYKAHLDELDGALGHLSVATLMLELLAATAREKAKSAYCSVIPWGSSLQAVKLYLGAVKAGRKKLDDTENLGRVTVGVMVSNFFPKTLARGMKLVETSFFGWSADRLVFRFMRGKERFELWTPNLDVVDAQGRKPDNAMTKFELYSLFQQELEMKYNLWKVTAHHVVCERNVTTMQQIAGGYDPAEIRDEIEKWNESRKGK